MVGRELPAARVFRHVVTKPAPLFGPRFEQTNSVLSLVRQLSSFLIAAVALAGLDTRFCVLLDVLSERATLIIRLLKLTLLITTDIAFVRTRID